VRKPQKGAPVDPHGQPRERLERSGRQSKLWGADARVTSPGGKARERRQVEILAEAFVEALEGQNPGEHPAVRVLKPCRVARDSRKGRNPGTAACQAGLHFGAGIPTGGTVGGFFRSETGWIPSGRRKLRRVNPRSAAGVKKNRRRTVGRKPSRG